MLNRTRVLLSFCASRFFRLSSNLLIISFLLTAGAIYTNAEESSAFGDTLVGMTDSVGNLLPAPPLAVTGMTLSDKPNDDGGAVLIGWELSGDDDGSAAVSGYELFRAISSEGPFESIGEVTRGSTEFTDGKAEEGVKYYYRVDAYFESKGVDGSRTRFPSSSSVIGPVSAVAQWFHLGRLICLILTGIISGAIMFYIRAASRGMDLYIRKIAGIDAVDEAVGRATEMGRKVFFIPGIQDMNDVQTIAGIAILGRVAALAAEYETWLEVPVSKSMVMVTARETMKEAYSKVGKVDLYQEAQVHYITDDQFGYAAAIDGMVVREKPATIFYMGAFFAESLILAETGNSVGAIQIAGTAMPSQLPFFVASCDYTLIGEELFAASAYLSREPRQLGSLKGQDFGKGIFLAAIFVGIVLELFGIKILGQMPSELFSVK